MAVRAVVLLLATLAVIGQVAYLDTLFWNALGLVQERVGRPHPSFMTVVVMDALLTAVTATFAVMMAFRGEEERAARSFAVALAAWSYLIAYSGVVILLRPDSPASPIAPLFAGHFLVVEFIGLAGLLGFSGTFPREVAPADLEDPRTLPVGLRTLQRFRRWILRPASPWLAGLAAAVLSLGVNRALGRPLQDTPLLPMVDFIRFATLAFVILNLRQAYLLSSQLERRRAQWIAVGFALLLGSIGLLIGGNVLMAVTGWSIPTLNWRQVVLSLGVVGLLWGMSMGVFYEGGLDPAHMGRRALIVAALTALGLLMGAGLEALFSDVLFRPASLPGGLGVLVSFGIAWTAYVNLGGPMERFLEDRLHLGTDGSPDEMAAAG